MPTLWIDAQVIEALAGEDRRIFGDLAESLELLPPKPPGGARERTVRGWRFQFAGLVGDAIGVFEAQPVDRVVRSQASSGRRALLIPSEVLDEYLSDYWQNIWARFEDLSNIDEARQRQGLKFHQQGEISAIFLPGTYKRITFVREEGLVVASEIVEGETFARHSASATAITDPAAHERNLWSRLHEVAATTRQATTRLVCAAEPTRPSVELPPLADGWITLVRLKELGVTGEATVRTILALRTASDLEGIVGAVPDDVFEEIERRFNVHDERERMKAARAREDRFTSMEIVQLSRSSSRLKPASEYAVTASYDDMLGMLSPEQNRIVTRDHDSPIRLKGGPGTGKTLTALLRAGFLAQRAKERGVAVRIGFFVFNDDLGRDIAGRMEQMGLGEFFAKDSRQQIIVTSLHDWCRRFVKLDELGVEPLEPYRADRTQANRRAALQLAVEEARARMSSAEHAPLWAQFDAKSKSGLREIEMEISQFIKASDITDLQTYLSKKRPSKWWLANTERPFKTFVWEVASIYGSVLRELGFMDADDLVNDAAKEVSKSVWQTFQKPEVGFDYLILDEAQDFFRNQLTLIRQIVKRPEGIMMCYDDAQAVYARYPSLREIGFDTTVNFESTKLERNFRSTKAIVSAIRELSSRYPTVDLEENWGTFSANDSQPAGTKPHAAGFATEEGMFAQVRELLNRAIAAGTKASALAVLGFDDELLERLMEYLRKEGVKLHVVEGDGRRPGPRSVSIANARFAKGQQFDTCILVGLDRDSVPDFRDAKSALHSETKREDDLRVFLVALSRAKTAVHMLWRGTEPSEFIVAMGHAIDRAE